MRTAPWVKMYFGRTLEEPYVPPYIVGMATILELARFAEVSPENVLRVLNGEPVSAAVSESVQRAIEALGEPAWPGGVPEHALETSIEQVRQELAQTFSRSTAELEARLPEGVGSIVYEAVRVEVRPVTEHIEQMRVLVDQLCQSLQRVGTAVDQERVERLEDVALLTDLIVTGWRSVDRRLARLERMLERQSAQNVERQRRREGSPTVRHIRLEG